ncbi:MAG: hypothetical protein GX071_14425 [Gammaproteobacteria bacterium]|nr:hypothetical protein [Gammaproteobacteria bacterium]
MKSTGVLAMALFVTTAATSLHASDNQENLQRCRAAIEDSLGENTATRLYDIRNRRGGDRLVIKALPGQGSSLMLDCRVYRDGSMSLQSREGLVLVDPSDKREQLTLSR